jgi:hypothetical protein
MDMWAQGMVLEGSSEAANDARAILFALDIPFLLTAQQIGSP